MNETRGKKTDNRTKADARDMALDLQQNDMATLYEKALLGFIVQDPQKMLSVSEILPKPEYFSDPDNRAAYGIFLKLFQDDIFPGSPTLVVKALYTGGDKQHFTTENEAARYVNELLDIPVNNQLYNPSAYIEYAEQIKWERDRQLIKDLSKETLSGADRISYEERENFIGGIEDKLGEITMSIHGKDGLKHISDMTAEVSEELDLLHSGQRLASGILTGIDSLDKTLNGLKGGEVCVLAGRPGQGKCLPRLTFILACKMPDRTPYLTTMGELEVGDYVYNRHGAPVKITGVFPQGMKDAYQLTFSDGRTVVCNEEHIWPYWQKTHRNGQRAEIINNMTLQEMLNRGIYEIKPHEVDDPTRRNRSRFSMPINDAVEFPVREHKISPYVMGVFLGDGCKNKNGRFELSSELEYHVAQIADMLGAIGYKRHKTSYSWSFYSKSGGHLRIAEIDPDYVELLSNTYCGDKYIPEEYLYDSIDNRWELLRGLMDADGTIYQEPWRNPLEFCTTSKKMAYDFRFLCNSLGLIARIKENDRRGQKHVTHGKEYVRKSIEYNISIRCPNEMKEKFFTIKHKLERAKLAAEHGATRNAKYDRIQLKKVEKLPEKQDMVCISVDDEEELFLCNDFLVTHNTTLSMQIAYNVAMAPREDNKKNSVLIFSLEMMEKQLVSRMIATIGRINMQAMMEEYQHFVNDHYYEKTYGKAFEEKMKMKLEEQYQRTQIALDHIKTLPIYPTTESGLSPNAIKSMVMQKKRDIERRGEHLSLIVIDYLQLMVPAMTKTNANRTEEVGDMSRKMKLLAKEFDVPVLLLAQLNRNSEPTERPKPTDLRESGSIEQDADKIIFIWSENAEKGANDFPEYQDDNARYEAARKEQMKVIITVAKNRQGETGDCPVIFDKGFQTFVSQSSEYANGNTSESFNEFFEKYYQKTRNEDIFWPLTYGEIPEAFESHRYPKYRETPYLDSGTGTVYTLSNDNRDGSNSKMRVGVSNTYTNANQSVDAARDKASVTSQGSPNGASPAAAATSTSHDVAGADFDRSRPSQPPVIDDLETGFEELDDEPVADSDYEPAGMVDEKLPWEDDDGDIEMDSPVADSTSDDAAFLDDDDDELLDLEMLDDLDDVLGLDD